jgi:hypothetical protein
VAHHNAHGKLDSVENNEEGINVFSKGLDDWDVPNLCQISGVRISGWQFFPCEGIRQSKKLFDVGFSKTVMRTKLQLLNGSVLVNYILYDRFLYLYFEFYNSTVIILNSGKRNEFACNFGYNQQYFEKS